MPIQRKLHPPLSEFTAALDAPFPFSFGRWTLTASTRKAEAEAARARELLEDLGAAAKATPTVPRDELLTARQLEVLRLISEGLTDGEIAARLVLSKHTVHRHVQNTYARLGCCSRASAVAEATRLQLL